MKDTTSAKAENRKALPLFLLIVICSFAVGILFGILSVNSEGAPWQDTLRAALRHFFTYYSSYILLALALCLIIGGIVSIRAAKKRIAALDDSDEGFRAADQLLSNALNAVSAINIVSFFFLSGMMCYFMDNTFAAFLIGLISFLVILAAQIVITQRLVDLAKQLYPEKRGSVYDLRFQKKWLESCDEAEKAQIAAAAFSAYRAANTACLAMWLLMTLSHMFFRTGLLPIFAVSVIWLTTCLAYAIKGKKMDTSGILI